MPSSESLLPSQSESYEWSLFRNYWNEAQDEQPCTADSLSTHGGSTLVVARGFEERSVGILEKCVEERIAIRELVIARYPEETLNSRFHRRFLAAAHAL